MIILDDRRYRNVFARLIPFYGRSQIERHRIAFHEAGHAIVAYHMGKAVTGVYLQGGPGWTVQTDDMTHAERRRTEGLCCYATEHDGRGSAYDRIAIFMAGIAGCVVGGHIARAHTGSGSDLMQVCEAIGRLPLSGNGNSPAYQKLGYAYARSIIEMDIGRFAALAQHLVLHGSVHGNFDRFMANLIPMNIEFV
jgi:hypothetical protein